MTDCSVVCWSDPSGHDFDCLKLKEEVVATNFRHDDWGSLELSCV